MKSSATWFFARKRNCEFAADYTSLFAQRHSLLTPFARCRLRRYISSMERTDNTTAPTMPRSPGPGKEGPADRAAQGKGKERGMNGETSETAGLAECDPPISSGADPQSSLVGTPLALRPAIDPYWPAEHLSGSEPKIYPGVVSRGQRSNSTKQGDW